MNRSHDSTSSRWGFTTREFLKRSVVPALSGVSGEASRSNENSKVRSPQQGTPGTTKRESASKLTFDDTYARVDEPTRTWTIGRSMIEAKVRFANVAFALIGIENKLTRRQYFSQPDPAEKIGQV